jgi:uncharacterized protein (DUF362 family)
MGKVSIVKASTPPDSEAVQSMVKRAIDLVGGLKDIIHEGDTVALKPNVVTGRVSKPGVITDRRIVEAMIRLSLEVGARKVMVVEGSGYFTPTDVALEKSGIKAAAEALGAEVVNVDEDKLVELKVPDPLVFDKIPVSKSFMDADVRINLPVMKTHDQLIVTLGVKNLKGVIPKPVKRLFHRTGLVKAILDLNKAVPIDLTVLDAINAMEGLGPSFGDIVPLNTIIASRDVWSLDVVASQVMGFELEELDYLVEGKRHGLVDPGGVEVVGEPISSVARRFKRPPTDAEFGPGLTVISDGACSACRGTIHSVLYDLEQLRLMGEIRDLFIVVGSNAKVPKGLKRTPIVMGTCLKQYEGEGCYVVGCPPNNDQMLAAIRKVCGLS